MFTQQVSVRFKRLVSNPELWLQSLGQSTSAGETLTGTHTLWGPGRVGWSCCFYCCNYDFFPISLTSQSSYPLPLSVHWNTMKCQFLSFSQGNRFLSWSTICLAFEPSTKIEPQETLVIWTWVSAPSFTFWDTGCDPIPCSDFNVSIQLFEWCPYLALTFTLQESGQLHVNLGTLYSESDAGDL